MRVDFKRLQQIPIEEVCNLLGLSLNKKGAQLRGPCPVCQHESERAFTVTPKLGRWWCFAYCRAGGDGLELVARVRQTTKVEAARFLADNFKERA